MARKPLRPSGYLTTFDVAGLLGVSPPTVVNWINAGLLLAHRTPGGHRRVSVQDLETFARAHAYPLPPEFSARLKLRRVLVVDDQRDFTGLVVEHLAAVGGWISEVAHSGFAAGYAVAQFKPDVILMDLRMPECDGFEVLARLRADLATRAIPVVACTGDGDPALVERVAQAGFVALVQKPVRLDRLAEVLGRAAKAAITPDYSD